MVPLIVKLIQKEIMSNLRSNTSYIWNLLTLVESMFENSTFYLSPYMH